MAQDREKDHSFRTLASYIGVFRTPENTGHATNKPQAIAMTAPVVFQNGKAILQARQHLDLS